MDVNGCRVISKLCADNPEGFSTTVSRSITSVTNDASGKVIVTETPVLRGPFKTIYAAQKYAMSWKDAANPPEVPVPEPVDPLAPKAETVETVPEVPPEPPKTSGDRPDATGETKPSDENPSE